MEYNRTMKYMTILLIAIPFYALAGDYDYQAAHEASEMQSIQQQQADAERNQANVMQQQQNDQGNQW